MKFQLQRLLAPLVLGVTVAFVGCVSVPKGGDATLEFINPEGFVDLQIPGKTREETVPVVMTSLQQEVRDLARDSIPAGFVVRLRITEIDQAGTIENPGGAFPIRVVGANSPAVIAFDYAITGSSNQVVKSGHQRLVQIPENLQPFMDTDSPVPLIKYMLGDWMGSLGWELRHRSRGTVKTGQTP